MPKQRQRIQGANQPNPPGELDVVLFASETTDVFDDKADESGSLTYLRSAVPLSARPFMWVS
jgi:hypothetical protein